ncbi:hypothetical protein ALP71_00172 [Pseudomonas coronafaciens pv. garcae]|nr:hypothetical protein ALP71_00172 [Pseudomonas coronafaciens pv. garcae]
MLAQSLIAKQGSFLIAIHHPLQPALETPLAANSLAMGVHGLIPLSHGHLPITLVMDTVVGKYLSDA